MGRTVVDNSFRAPQDHGEVISVNYPLIFAAMCDSLESGFLLTVLNHEYGRIYLLEETFRVSKDEVLLPLLSVDPGLLQ